ncbi:MAG: hypothetical protein K2M23_02225, partial [Alphaproteobacteria bacterium]|nr:hypothetical protein [Alphaproteobacteria bacterium]
MVSYRDFLSSPNKAQAINRSMNWGNLNNNAMASNNSWLIGLTSALQSGLGMYDAMKSRDQEKEASEKYDAYNKNIADALKGKDYEGAANLANLYGLRDDADKYYQMGVKERDYNDTITQRNFDNDITTGREERADKQLAENIRRALVGEDLSNRQFEENKSQNKFKNDFALSQFEHTKSQDEFKNNLAKSQFDYSKSQDEIANALRQNQFDYQKQRDLT